MYIKNFFVFYKTHYIFCFVLFIYSMTEKSKFQYYYSHLHLALPFPFPLPEIQKYHIKIDQEDISLQSAVAKVSGALYW